MEEENQKAIAAITHQSEEQRQDETFIPDVRVCVTVMNGKTDLLILDDNYRSFFDISKALVKDEKLAA